jgi:hypothetical protein
MKEKRIEAIAELENALDEIKSGEGLSTFVEGHGLQSHRFRFEWSEPLLQISYDLPTGRVLAPEEDQKADDAEAGAAIRLAIVLLRAFEQGKPEAFEDGSLSVYCDDDGARYEILADDGSVIDEQEGWSGLASRLECVFENLADDLMIIWP